MYHILVVDDDREILKLIRTILELHHYQVTTYQEVRLPIDPMQFIGFDLILLDGMLTNTDGLEICKAIRQQVRTPIVFVSARDSEEDIVQGLQLGGDDYITKPFGVKQLLAKVEAHLKREERSRQVDSVRRELPPFTFYLEEKTLCIHEQPISLTRREYDILELLSRYPKKVFTREEIYQAVYDEDADALFHSISEYVYQIRTKCSVHGMNPIQTVRGRGYKWYEEKLFD